MRLFFQIFLACLLLVYTFILRYVLFLPSFHFSRHSVLIDSCTLPKSLFLVSIDLTYSVQISVNERSNSSLLRLSLNCLTPDP